MKRIITKKFLKLYGFRFDETLQMWYKTYSHRDAYKWESLKYDFENRILYSQGYYVVGADDVCEMDEKSAYSWIKHLGIG